MQWSLAARSVAVRRPAPLTTLVSAALLVTPLAASGAVLARGPATAALGAAAGADCFVQRGYEHDNLGFEAPAGDRPTEVDRAGTTILPNGRLLTPAGANVTVAPHPFGLALSPDGRRLASANSGTAPFSISIVSDPAGPTPAARQIPPGTQNDPAVLKAVFMGLAIAGDNRTLYVSGGNDGSISIFDIETGAREATVDLNVPAAGRSWKGSYIGDLKLSADGKWLWAVDQANFRLVGVDLGSLSVAKVAPPGRYPFGVALTPDGKFAYVANVGMYRYDYVAGFDPRDPPKTGLPFPPFAQGSPEARDGTVVDGKSVPGLGDPNAPESFSVWAIDLGTLQPAAKLKTGPLVGQVVDGIPAVGGSSPNSVVTDGKRVYVSNNHSDTVAVIDVATNRVIKQIRLEPSPDRALARLRGTMPFGVALTPDGGTLFVAESGINAVAMVDTRTLAVQGHIPTGWLPAKVAVSPDAKRLYVTNAKGYGSGPNGGAGFVPGPEGTYIGDIQKGTVSLIDVPNLRTAAGRRQLRGWTQQVIKNNGFQATGRHAIHIQGGRVEACPIHHVIFVTKENRTYDEVFGDLGTVGARAVNGDPSLARYGQGVTPNHHALARRFAHDDNFYVDSDVSADGHRWLVGVAPDEFVETSWAASYGGARDFRYDTSAESAPGRRGFTESNAALAPEDYPEAGSIWDNFDRNRVSFYNYGEGFELAGIFEDPGYEPTGARLPVNVPMAGPLFGHTDRSFPTFNMNISDQYRVDEFERNFKGRFVDGIEELPRFTYVYLPNDHTAGARPAAGYPSRESYVADNDLALGRIVDVVSHSKYWSSTAIFVTEDDAQSGVDHVDAHRSFVLVISPWSKHGYVSARHTSLVSIIKTINQLTGAPALNLYDAAASGLQDAFTFAVKPDLAPYDAIPEDPHVFDPSLVKKGGFTNDELRGGKDIDNPNTISELHREELQHAPAKIVRPDD